MLNPNRLSSASLSVKSNTSRQGYDFVFPSYVQLFRPWTAHSNFLCLFSFFLFFPLLSLWSIAALTQTFSYTLLRRGPPPHHTNPPPPHKRGLLYALVPSLSVPFGPFVQPTPMVPKPFFLLGCYKSTAKSLCGYSPPSEREGQFALRRASL